jgi:hypothetical protein
MNNNLVPEQRLDKNGRLNTKHVRVNKPLKASSVPPSPRLSSSTKTNLTKGQKTPVTRTLDFYGASGTDNTGNEYISALLGVKSASPTALIHASDAEIYALLSVTSGPNTDALLRAGYRTAKEAVGYLNENGLSRLIEDRTTLCDEALNRRIAPQKFLTAVRVLPPAKDSAHFIDAVEVYSSSYIMDGMKLAQHVYHGRVRVEDMHEIGFKEIGRNTELRAITDALQKVATDPAPYTAADIKELLVKHPNRFGDAIKLGGLYGAELALALNRIDMGYANHLQGTATNERIITLLKYNDQINDYEGGRLTYKDPATYAKIEKYHDCGIAPSLAANNGCTDQQLEAIMSGMTTGVSAGWL